MLNLSLKVINVVSNIINDVYVNNKEIENFFKNIKDKKEGKLDILLNC